MSVTLHHINISAPAQELASARDFYCALLGLQCGPRPAFRNPGYWLYAGAEAIIHLTQRPEHFCRHTLREHSTFDHIAFACDDLPAMRTRLQQLACAVREVEVPALLDEHGACIVPAQIQLFLHDPLGNQLELNFSVA